jgi:hypothetical protein
MPDIVTPAGVLVKNAPPGLLQFLVGIQDNESGFDYYRAQGSAGGTDQAPDTSVGGGYGAYQFQQDTDQYNKANAANWDPAVQDSIAAQMAIGYYKQFGGDWRKVTEAWYAPGWVQGTPDEQQQAIAGSSVDWGNVSAALEGHPNLPSDGWDAGQGNGGYFPQYDQLQSVGAITNELNTDKATPAQIKSAEQNSAVEQYTGIAPKGLTVTGTTGANSGSGFLHTLQGVLNPSLYSSITGFGAPTITMLVARAGFSILGLALASVGAVILYAEYGGGAQTRIRQIQTIGQAPQRVQLAQQRSQTSQAVEARRAQEGAQRAVESQRRLAIAEQRAAIAADRERRNQAAAARRALKGP